METHTPIQVLQEVKALLLLLRRDKLLPRDAMQKSLVRHLKMWFFLLETGRHPLWSFLLIVLVLRQWQTQKQSQSFSLVHMNIIQILCLGVSLDARSL